MCHIAHFRGTTYASLHNLLFLTILYFTHPHARTYTHTHTHVYAHSHAGICASTHVCTITHIHTNTQAHVCAHSHTRSRWNNHRHTSTCMCMCILAHADKIADTQTHERMHLLTLKHLQRHTFSDHHTTSATIRIDITYIVRMLAHTLTHNTRAHGRCVQRVVAQPPLLG